MTPLEMIAEWETGCSNTIGKLPETCSYCTAALIEALKRALLRPIKMVLFCPACGTQHIDAPNPEFTPKFDSMRGQVIVGPDITPNTWTNPPHKSHVCQNPRCGHQWRPADVETEGVAEIETRRHDDSPPVRPVGPYARECLQDVISHYNVYDSLLNHAYKNATGDDVSYWSHERAALARMSLQAHTALSEPGENANETYQRLNQL